MNVVPNHTLETLRALRDSLQWYEEKGDPKFKDAIRIEEGYYRDVLEQTLESNS